MATNDWIDATPPFSSICNRLLSAFMASISDLHAIATLLKQASTYSYGSLGASFIECLQIKRHKFKPTTFLTKFLFEKIEGGLWSKKLSETAECGQLERSIEEDERSLSS